MLLSLHVILPSYGHINSIEKYCQVYKKIHVVFCPLRWFLVGVRPRPPCVLAFGFCCFLLFLFSLWKRKERTRIKNTTKATKTHLRREITNNVRKYAFTKKSPLKSDFKALGHYQKFPGEFIFVRLPQTGTGTIGVPVLPKLRVLTTWFSVAKHMWFCLQKYVD